MSASCPKHLLADGSATFSYAGVKLCLVLLMSASFPKHLMADGFATFSQFGVKLCLCF